MPQERSYVVPRQSQPVRPTLLLLAAVLGFLLGCCNLSLGLAYLGVVPDLADELRLRPNSGYGTWLVVCGAALLVGALGLRRERLWSWWLSLAAIAVTAVVCGLGGNWLAVVISVLVVALLLNRTSRRVVRQTPAERELSAIEDRGIRRAKRRLTPDEPTLDGVSFGNWKPPGRRDEDE